MFRTQRRMCARSIASVKLLEFRQCDPGNLQAIKQSDLVKGMFKLVDHYPKIGKIRHHIAVTSKPKAQKAATMTSSEFVIIATSRRHAGFAASPR